MAHDHGKHDHHSDHHHHDHDHDHDHGDGHHHHHDHDDHHHHHDWHSKDYVSGWIARDAGHANERRPIIERLIAAVPFPRDAAIDVLDVGAGSGVITAAILGAFPRARVTMQDYSQPMIERARERFAADAARVRYVLCDLHDPDWASRAGGPFDLAVSAIALHNLHDLAKMSACYDAIRGLLKSGGCFIDYDHFDRVGGVPLHQHSLRVAGFNSVDIVWHEHPTAVLKASV